MARLDVGASVSTGAGGKRDFCTQRRQVGALLAVAILGTTGHLLLILALGKAPASTLMPFQYAQLAVAALAGYVVFRLAPDGWSWFGMAIIGVCGATSAWLNMRAAAERHRPVSAVQADTVAE